MTPPRHPGGALSMAGQTVLAVFAHPDDESLACGGTLARLADLGARVVVFCASKGERGAVSGPARDDQLGAVRARELRQACSALGVADLVIFDHPDGDLQWADVAAFHGEITLGIQHYRPTAVVTFGRDGLYWHADHIGVHERATTAVRALGQHGPALYYVTMPRGVIRPLVDIAAARGWTPPAKGFWSLNPDAFGLHADPPSIVVDVGDWIDRKRAAMACHRTQLGHEHPFEHLDQGTARQWLGEEHFHRALVGADTSVLERLATGP